MDSKDNVYSDRFKTLCNEIGRSGICDLMQWLDSTDFYIAPASTKYHGAFLGGLVMHSLDVYDEMQKILTIYPEFQIQRESTIICALFHDFCKVNFYTSEKRHRKNDSGEKEEYDFYKIDEQYIFGGHGSKSVYLIQQFMSLLPEEAAAINCHMGAFENENVTQVYQKYPLAWVLHVADEAAAFFHKEK